MSFTSRDEGAQRNRGLPGPHPAASGVWNRLGHFLAWYRHIFWSLLLVLLLACLLLILPSAIRHAFSHALLAHRVLTGMFLVFSLLALSLLWTTGQRIDANIFFVFNLRGVRPPWLDAIMLWCTHIGSSAFAVFLALCLFSAGKHALMYTLLLGVVTLWLVVEAIKAIIRRSRPFHRITNTRVVGYRAGGRSFPSGHTSQVFFLAILLIQYFHLNMGSICVLYALALLVGITRMYVGAHYPRDVLGGIILGSAWGILASMVRP